MILLVLASIVTAVFFGVLAIIFSLKEDRVRKTLLEKEISQKHRLYQISILKEIQDRIGYSLDIEKVIDVIIGSLKNLFPYSISSSLIIEGDHLLFKAYINESVSHNFVEQVKKSMIASLNALLGNLPSKIDERLHGVPLDDTNPFPLASFFHIPLIVNNKVVGLINVSSVKLNLYKENEMTILYQIVSQASNALSRLEEVLKTEKGKLEATITSLADGIFLLDTNNRLLIINDAAKHFLGIEKDNPTFLDLLTLWPKAYDLTSKINESITKNITIEDNEIKIQTRIFQVFITPVRPIGVSVMLHDRTIEKNLAQMKEDFINMMVHELRAPLTTIKDSAELLLSHKTSLKNAQQKQFLEIIHKESETLLSQIALILDAAKFESGTFSLYKKQGDLDYLIREQIKIFLPQAEKKGLLLTTDIAPNLPHIPFDEERVIQVINNLISNSIKFTQTGGKINISANIISDLDGNSLVKVSVSDTGIGIPKEKQAGIFSKFYQIKEGRNGAHTIEGTGLGLYIVKNIIEAHGGSIEMESEEGHGTTMSFTLPMEDKQVKTQSNNFIAQMVN